MKNLLNILIKNDYTEDQLLLILINIYAAGVFLKLIIQVLAFNILLLIIPNYTLIQAIGAFVVSLTIMFLFVMIRMIVNVKEEKLKISSMLKIIYTALIKDRRILNADKRIEITELILADKDNDFENALESKTKTLSDAAWYQIISMEDLTDEDFNKYKEKGYYEKFGFNEEGERRFKDREKQYNENIIKEKVDNF